MTNISDTALVNGLAVRQTKEIVAYTSTKLSAYNIKHFAVISGMGVMVPPGADIDLGFGADYLGIGL